MIPTLPILQVEISQSGYVRLRVKLNVYNLTTGLFEFSSGVCYSHFFGCVNKVRDPLKGNDTMTHTLRKK